MVIAGAVFLCDFLDRAWWLGFGKDADGVKHDRERAQAAIQELEGY